MILKRGFVFQYEKLKSRNAWSLHMGNKISFELSFHLSIKFIHFYSYYPKHSSGLSSELSRDFLLVSLAISLAWLLFVCLSKHLRHLQNKSHRKLVLVSKFVFLQKEKQIRFGLPRGVTAIGIRCTPFLELCGIILELCGIILELCGIILEFIR